MKNKWLSPICFISGLLISGTAAYYSIFGLAKIFSATFYAVVIFGVGMEIAKLVTASWLWNNWLLAPKILKFYMTLAVVILMVITSAGIYGFLSYGYSEQIAPIITQQIQIESIDQQVAIEQDTIAQAKVALNQLNKMIDQQLSNDKTNQSIAQRKRQSDERATINATIKDSSTNIAQYLRQKAQLKTDNQTTEREVGPINFIAKSIYGDSTRESVDRIVKWMMVLLVLVFDPLAIALLLAANFSVSVKETKTYRPKKLIASSGPVPATAEEVSKYLKTKAK